MTDHTNGDVLPALLDCKSLMAELSVSRTSAEKVMRQVPSVVIPGLRKSFVRRSDVAALLDSCTLSKDRVAP